MKRIICLAGKNSIILNAMRHLQNNIDLTVFTLVACLNKSDTGEDNWQPSFASFCKKNNIPVLSLEALYELENLLFISLEFDRIIKPEKFSTSRLFNIHFSKLPAYKGMYTSVFPLLQGMKESGVTLHRIDKGIDTGEIVDHRTFPLPLDYNSNDLYNQCLRESYILFVDNIRSLIDGTEISSKQPFEGSSYYSKISLAFSALVIDYNKTAFEIHNQLRAYSFRAYQLPVFNGIAIYKSEILLNQTEGKPGTVAHENQWHIIVNTIDYQVKLYIDKLDCLLDAAARGDIETYASIEKNGFPISTKNKKGWDALIVACYNNKIDFMQMLLNAGWDVNTKNYNETTAAMYAMTASGLHDDISILKKIASYSPDWKSRDRLGKDIFQYAQEYNNSKVIAFLNTLVR